MMYVAVALGILFLGIYMVEELAHPSNLSSTITVGCNEKTAQDSQPMGSAPYWNRCWGGGCFQGNSPVSRWGSKEGNKPVRIYSCPSLQIRGDLSEGWK